MKRFATEWLWFMGCVAASAAITVVYLLNNPGSDASEAAAIVAIFGIIGGIGGYLIMGAVRLTVWAVTQQRP